MMFVKNNNCKDGYENICKSCKNIRRKNRYEQHYKNLNPLTTGKKKCKKCGQEKDILSYPVDLKCLAGRRNICNVCTNKRVSEKYHANKHSFNSIYWNRKAESVNKRANGKGSIGVTGIELKRIFINQDYKCAYCRVELLPKLHVEHKTPLSSGGKHNIDNICFSCPDCNRLKHTRNSNEFLEFLHEYIKRFI